MPDFPTTRHVLESDCQRCPRLVESRECISWATGSLEAAVLVVGEAPGAGNPDADRWAGGNWTGKAYTARHSGRRIRTMLEELGVDAAYTNAIKCFPADANVDVDGSPTNREPTADERANCRPYLRQEIELIEPTAILTTGKHATQSVLALEGRDLESGFLETVLEPVRCESLGTWLLPVVHPSYQDVWIGRLGYERNTYLAAIGNELEAIGALE